MTAKKPIYKLKYVYAGKRSNSGGEIYQMFLLDGKTQVYFKGIKGVYIGRTYLGGKSQIPRRPERVPDGEEIKVSAKDIDSYHAEEMIAEEAARQRREKAKAEEKIKILSQSARIKAVKKEVHEITSGMGHFERMYFIEALLYQRPPKKIKFGRKKK